MVNLEWYRTFKAIYQTGNLTRAAEELLISQPNVSVQLASLESYVGQKLFERRPRRLIPTEYGKMLYTQIVESVENLERVEVEFRKAALNRIGNMRIGSPIEYARHILLKEFGECKANVYLKFGMTQELIDQLDNKELDFVIATQQIEKSNIVYEPLVCEEFMIVAPASLETSDFDIAVVKEDWDVVEKWLLAQVWIAYDSKLSLVRRFWKENFNKRPLIKPHFVIPDISMMVDAVCLDYGITVVSSLFVNESDIPDDLKILWRGKNITSNQLWLAYKPLQVEDERLTEIKRILKLEK